MRNRIFTKDMGYAFAAALLAVALIVISDGPDEQELAHAEYCEMVALNRADPDLGWPDFKNIYDSECAHEADETR